MDSDEEGVSLGNGEDEDFTDDSSEEEELAELENRAVYCLRGTVIAVLAVSALLIGYVVHVATTTPGAGAGAGGEGSFPDVFRRDSTDLAEQVRRLLLRSLKALDGFALDLESFAKEAGGVDWPTVTLPDFDRRASNALDLADAPHSLTLVPLLLADDGGRNEDLADSSEIAGSVERWENYSVHHQDWLVTRDNDRGVLLSDVTVRNSATSRRRRQMTVRGERSESISERIFNQSGPCDTGTGPFAPLWQTSPIVPGLVEWVNFDLFSMPMLGGGLRAVLDGRQAVLGEVAVGSSASPMGLYQVGLAEKDGVDADPISSVLYPLLGEDQNVVGFLAAMVSWQRLISLPSLSSKSIVAVVRNNCGQEFSFAVNEDGKGISRFLGVGDLHDNRFSDMNKTISIASAMNSTAGTGFNQLYCPYSVSIYPSQATHDAFRTVSSVTCMIAVFLVFFFAAGVFALYDALVERRQKVVMNRAVQSSAIVSQLFPEQVHDRLFRRGSIGDHRNDDCSLTVDETPPVESANPLMPVAPAKQRLKSFLTECDEAGAENGARPIADLFPNCTVLFADISGFTAWSSLRDPAQVFTLLEAVYQAFDRIARKRGVFKVETIGDSYVAVTGLPEPQEDHAVIMARFARDCRARMTDVTRKLEITLGPDTGDLRMRFGLHSGPVTAGVLRGEKSRFQLFGDTVNTAARMESTGERDKIQISEATAERLRQAGKSHWLRKREELVKAKGKGEMQTYFVEFTSRRDSTGNNSRCSISSIDSRMSNCSESRQSVIWGADEEIPEAAVTQRTKHQRLIDYNVDLLSQLLKQVVARRKALEMAGRRCSQGGMPPNLESHAGKVQHGTVLEEVTEVIKLPSFNSKAFRSNIDPDSIDLGPVVHEQLKRFVTIIAAMYRNNPFHNFEHASHVTMSVNKLLQRVVAPDITFKRRSLQMTDRSFKKQVASDLHAYTYGITSDPLTQFAIVFSALIHDVDHWGRFICYRTGPSCLRFSSRSFANSDFLDLSQGSRTTSSSRRASRSPRNTGTRASRNRTP